jgi:hypothetical protein
MGQMQFFKIVCPATIPFQVGVDKALLDVVAEPDTGVRAQAHTGRHGQLKSTLHKDLEWGVIDEIPNASKAGEINVVATF